MTKFICKKNNEFILYEKKKRLFYKRLVFYKL